MSSVKIKRVMWLINHTTLRKFEISMLKKLGVSEIFTPKNFPYDEGNLSASVTYEFDKTLTLSESEIEILNKQEWYKNADDKAWSIVNRHFDAIFLAFFPQQIDSVASNFKGIIILRPFGLCGEERYSKLIRQIGGTSLQASIMNLGKRFYFGMAYPHLADNEEYYLSSRAVYLPAGLANTNLSNKWQGKKEYIFFVCPRILSSPYYNNIYQDFKKNFKGMPYYIGGKQPIKVLDPSVLGFLTEEEYAEIMQQSRVMFYHSQEPRHIHYHPFEAIREGMPLVFMANGVLDTLGGKKLPGRCKSFAEARRKIKKLLLGDKRLIEKIKESQNILLDTMDSRYCFKFWKKGFNYINNMYSEFKKEMHMYTEIKRKKRVALIIPEKYKGGTLRGAISLAKALHLGSKECQDNVDIVLAHINDTHFYRDEDFAELNNIASIRPFRWKYLTAEQSRNAMFFAGYEEWEPDFQNYAVMDDDIVQMTDCDVWLFISDRVTTPILPIKPYIVMVYDYVQRYVDVLCPQLNQVLNQAFFSFARAAKKIWVTTKFTYDNALQYAGVDKDILVFLPMLTSSFPINQIASKKEKRTGGNYFIWTTNSTRHKNHYNAFQALQIYYEEFEGKLECQITGINSENILNLCDNIQRIFENSQKLQENLNFLGNLADRKYHSILSQARFLWHPAIIDNGTFSVIEACSLEVPSLSSDYPAMHEINVNFDLNLTWQNSNLPEDMAKQLKYMELKSCSLRKKLPSLVHLRTKSIEAYAKIYYKELIKCL